MDFMNPANPISPLNPASPLWIGKTNTETLSPTNPVPLDAGGGLLVLGVMAIAVLLPLWLIAWLWRDERRSRNV
jgi:hypothetical protein